MNRKTRLLLLAAALILLAGALPAAAQEAGADTTATAVDTQAPPPPPKASSPSKAGPFAQGRKRLGVYAGAGSMFGQTYVILGAGIGYYVADGLELGFDAEGWLFQDPTMWKLTPQLRYVIWQMGHLKPYLGAFYRWNLIEDPFEDYNSYGGRAGIAYQSGGNYAALGVVYEVFEDDIAGDSSTWYPEIALWISF